MVGYVSHVAATCPLPVVAVRRVIAANDFRLRRRDQVERDLFFTYEFRKNV